MHAVKIHFLSKTSQDSHVERVIDAPQVLADHLLGQALAGDEEAGHRPRRVLQEAPLDQVDDALVGFLVEDVQARAVVPLADDLVDGVHVGHDIVGHDGERRGGAGHHRAVL